MSTVLISRNKALVVNFVKEKQETHVLVAILVVARTDCVQAIIRL